MQKTGAITIKHVAAEAGVSFQTVSRVINDGPNVTPATVSYTHLTLPTILLV